MLGAGFDARWLRLADTLRGRVAEYRELDRPGLLGAKQALIARSPFAAAYAAVTPTAGDLFEILSTMPPAGRPTLVVIEGVLMYLEKQEQERLLDLLAQKIPDAHVMADAYSAHGVRAGNKRRRRILGGIDARFAWGPDVIAPFFDERGFAVKRTHALTPEIMDLMPFWRWLPIPSRIRDCYLLVEAQARRQ